VSQIKLLAGGGHGVPESYIDAHRYDGAAIERGHRARREPCAIQPRDVAVVRDVRRHKFLTAPQLRELFWPQRSIQAADRRLLKLFRAGYLERFRPLARRGSFPWTYHLGADGHRLLQHAGIIGPRERFIARAVYDYGHVLHELQLNAWVLATRRSLGSALVTWQGETHIEPPPEVRRAQLRLHEDWSAEGLRDPRARPVRPDAMLEVQGDRDEASRRLFLLEYDRTRRVDKNYDKFRRYDSFLCWWWRHAPLVDSDQPPFVLFICQDQNQRHQFLSAADREITGHRSRPSAPPEQDDHVGRRRILFAIERDAHDRVLEAWRLPAYPPGHPARRPEVRRVTITPARSQNAEDSASLPTPTDDRAAATPAR
jgi:Replication-relaxation